MHAVIHSEIYLLAAYPSFQASFLTRSLRFSLASFKYLDWSSTEICVLTTRRISDSPNLGRWEIIKYLPEYLLATCLVSSFVSFCEDSLGCSSWSFEVYWTSWNRFTDKSYSFSINLHLVDLVQYWQKLKFFECLFEIKVDFILNLKKKQFLRNLDFKATWICHRFTMSHSWVLKWVWMLFS